MKISSIIDNKPVWAANFEQKKQNRNNNLAENNHSGVSNKNMLVDKNYGILQTKKMNVSFTGAGLPAPAKTLGEKVGNLFNIVRSNDIIVAAPSFPKAVKSIDKNINSFKTVLKRVFFIEDKKLEGAVAFKRNLGEKEVVNLMDKPIFIQDSKKQAAFLKSGESGYLLEGDTIKAGNLMIEVKEQPHITLPVKDSFTFMLEFDKEVDPTIQKINKKSLEKLQEKSKGNEPKKVLFSDVGGQDEAIKELKKTILYPIKHPEIRNGKNMRKSAILSGPPGTGKSLLAEAAANESGAWFKKINASELDSKYVGESEQNWRNLFDEARENQPALIFIDEIDAIAKKRGGNDVYGDKTLNTILGLMSDSEKRGDEIYLLAATNNKQVLDSAVTRSGRFGVDIHVGAPDLKGTKQIFDIHTKNEPLAKDLDVKSITEKMHKEKATGADIASIAEEARSNALEREHIYEKMEDGTYTPDDMKNMTIKTEDFDKAIGSFKKKQESNGSKPRTQIGFNSPLYKK